MLQILNLEEAKVWSEKNLYEADCYLFPLSVAVKKGLLMEIDKEHFAVVETTSFGCTWVLDEIIKLTDEEMKENDLYCRYRYKAHVTEHPKGYNGAMEMNAGFNL
ncbi:MAG: hypothetical protein IJA10_01585 [Lachnospiraceae bacterium]|nr:hypothetical protein [Lachnospiraceae bacterium]